MTPATILAVALSLPSSYAQGDLSAVAEEIATVAKSPSEAATLIALGWHETKFSALVMAGHCDQLPAGARCDDGRALGPWQLHQAACPKAWALATPNGGPAGQRESLHEQAECAIRLLRWSAQRGRDHTLTPIHAAFAGYAARPWSWAGADVRVRTTRDVLGRLERARWSERRAP